MTVRIEGRYLPDAQLLAMRRRRMTLAEIAEKNYQATGFRPDRGNLSRLLADLGAEGRRSPVLLQHWSIRREHVNSRWRRMLAAKSKELEGGTPNDIERRAINLLDFLLNPQRGRKFVVTYHWQVGFCLVDAMPGENYIRIPEPIEGDDADDGSRSGARLELVN